MMSVSVLFYGRVKLLPEILSGRNLDFDLDRAALELAEIEYPRVEAEPSLAILDLYAEELRRRISSETGGAEFVAAVNEYLFAELGFAGNAKNYYDPRNSCLNEVLTSHTGIPITLSLVYMEVARRLARPVCGIGLPGHFVVRYDDGSYSTYIDPFHGGNLLSATECFQLARERCGAPIENDPVLLAPVTNRQIITRMMNNLRGIYFHRRSYGKLLRLLDLILTACPDSAQEYRQRGTVYLQLNRLSAAKSDLETYLSLVPSAADRANVEKQLRGVKRSLADLN